MSTLLPPLVTTAAQGLIKVVITVLGVALITISFVTPDHTEIARDVGGVLKAVIS